MSESDLTPKPYLKRVRTRAALRHWAVLVSGCALVTFSVVIFGASQGPDGSEAQVQERLTLAQARLAQSKSAIQSISATLKQYERELKAEQHLTRRPDWNAALSLVAQQFDEGLVMTGFDLGAMDDSEVRKALGKLRSDVPDDSVWLIVYGVADSNRAVPDLILRLEKMGLFYRVVMTGTQREAFAGASRMGFTLACRVQ